jgi:phosphoserine phosphatase RsbU/P
MRILIAEDDRTSLDVLSGVLKNGGHEVLETSDGVEAWDVLRTASAPRLAILDWMMPGMDGLEVVRRVRSLGSHHPPYLIMLTARTQEADIISGLEAGTNDYLAKPFHAGELLARVEVGRRMMEMQDALAAKVEDLQHALEEIETLRGIIPICAWCKRIRDDAGYWEQVEVYVRKHSGAEFSHSICPQCAQSLCPDQETS